MREYLKFYIDGQWVDPIEMQIGERINPATEEICGRIALGGAADVDKAVQAARKAFKSWSQTTREERLAVLERILEEFQKRAGDLAAATTEEMGAPAALANGFQVGLGLGHLTTAIEVLKNFEFEEQRGATRIVKEPIGVCGMITPWNWPINQVTVKVFPALATGCTMVLKPSQESHFSAHVLAEIFDAAGVPAGVFNLVQGRGSVVGAAISSHADIDMVSITGSESAGIEVAKNAADTIKRVCQELGGKSANIVLDDADFAENIGKGVAGMMVNSGQTCSAVSRMLVPGTRMDEAIAVAREAADQVTVGDPAGDFAMGPVVSKSQWVSVQDYIEKGIDEGATLVAGGPGRPEGLDKGFYVKPTVFANVRNDMVIAREEIFGPVLCIIPYSSVDEAVAIANDTEYGLSGYVYGATTDEAMAVARRLRTGMVHLNGAATDIMAPFGGYKQSGNGREWGAFGLEDFLEVKAVMGTA